MDSNEPNGRERSKTPGIRVTYTGIPEHDRRVVRAGRPVHEATRPADEESADADGDVGLGAD